MNKKTERLIKFLGIEAAVIVCAFVGIIIVVLYKNIDKTYFKCNVTYSENKEKQLISKSLEAEKCKYYPVETITLSFVGDCLLATNENENYSNCLEEVVAKENKEYCFARVMDVFKNDTFTIADCENVFSNSKLTPIGKDGEAYWFRSASENAEIFKAGGVDIVSIDNNHIGDFGINGKEDTIKALESANVLWGNGENIVYVENNEFKIAIICCTLWSQWSEENILKNLNEAKEKTDYQIIYFHGGTEGIYAPESWKVTACRNFVDNGADLVIGGHPHVLQPMEAYNGVNIVYSLGNFVFGGNRRPANATVIYQQMITIRNGEILGTSSNLIPCYVYTGDVNNWQPAIMENEEDKEKVIKFMHGEISSPY